MKEPMTIAKFLENRTDSSKGYLKSFDFRELPKAEIGIISVGGFGYRVFASTETGEIIGFIPKAKANIDRGCIYLYPDGTYKGDTCIFNGKLRAAVELLTGTILPICAGGGFDALSKAVSVETCVCARCGAALTDELSVSRGVGPECFKYFGGKRYVNAAIAARVAG